MNIELASIMFGNACASLPITYTGYRSVGLEC